MKETRSTPAPLTRSKRSGWSLNITKKEQTATLNVNIPARLRADLEVLSQHFGVALGEVTERVLEHALSNNNDLVEARKAAPRRDEGTTGVPAPGTAAAQATA